MPKISAPKPDTLFRNAKPKVKEYLITDAGGLYLLVRPDGSKHWIMRFRFQNTSKKIYLQGKYPEMSAKEAREEAALLRAQIQRGEYPVVSRKLAEDEAKKKRQLEIQASKSSFRMIAEEWLEVRMSKRSPSTLRGIHHRLQRNVMPWIGDTHIADLTAHDLLTVIRRVETKGKHETAHRVLSECDQIIKYGISTARIEVNVATNLKGALKPATKTHRAALINPQRFGGLLRDIDNYEGLWTVKYALKLLPLVFCRPSELRLAKWEEFDFERALWEIPANRMKLRKAHLVPLSRQALEILKELKSLGIGTTFLFPTPRQNNHPLSNVAMLNGIRRMGYDKAEQSAHGFRAIARTLLDERLHVPPTVIEAQLAHKVADSLGTAYNRTEHIQARTEMMQTWADYVDALKSDNPARREMLERHQQLNTTQKGSQIDTPKTNPHPGYVQFKPRQENTTNEAISSHADSLTLEMPPNTIDQVHTING